MERVLKLADAVDGASGAAGALVGGGALRLGRLSWLLDDPCVGLGELGHVRVGAEVVAPVPEPVEAKTTPLRLKVRLQLAVSRTGAGHGKCKEQRS